MPNEFKGGLHRWFLNIEIIGIVWKTLCLTNISHSRIGAINLIHLLIQNPGRIRSLRIMLLFCFTKKSRKNKIIEKLTINQDVKRWRNVFNNIRRVIVNFNFIIRINNGRINTKSFFWNNDHDKWMIIKRVIILWK